jgi:hypothetical protein
MEEDKLITSVLRTGTPNEESPVLDLKADQPACGPATVARTRHGVSVVVSRNIR